MANTHVAVVEALVAAGADANTKNKLGGTPMQLVPYMYSQNILAVRIVAAAILKHLLMGGGDVNKPIGSETPLHLYARYDKRECVALLLTCADCDITMTNVEGQTPEAAARSCGNVDIAEMIAAEAACRARWAASGLRRLWITSHSRRRTEIIVARQT